VRAEPGPEDLATCVRISNPTGISNLVKKRCEIDFDDDGVSSVWSGGREMFFSVWEFV